VGDAVKVTVKLDDRDLRDGIKALRKRFPYAVKRAISRATTSVKAQAAKEMRADTYLSSRFIKSELKVYAQDGGARIEVQGRRVPLITFGARGPEPSRGKGRGVSYRNPGGGRSRSPHAFIAKMRSGHRGVFARTGKGQLPIIEQFGPSLVRVFEKFLPGLAEHAHAALAKNLKHEISYALSKEK
jgi:hypothetical protein